MQKHTGPAKVYDSEKEALTAIRCNQVKEGDVVVIRYEGPRGGPGMPEMLFPTATIAGMGLSESVALITDGRFSGATREEASDTLRLKPSMVVPLQFSKMATR